MTRFNFRIVLIALLLAGSGAVLRAEAIYSQPLEVKEIPVGNHLVWQTISEFDITNFVIEKSTDGIAFYELGVVEGAGYSMVDNNYHFMDVGASDRTNYYRLKEVANDGTFSYSLPALLEKKLTNAINVIAMTNTEVASTFKLTADVFQEGTLQCKLTDRAGKTLQSYTVRALNGLNDLEVHLEDYAPGNYRFTVQMGQETESVLLHRVADERNTRPQVADTKKTQGGRQ